MDYRTSTAEGPGKRYLIQLGAAMAAYVALLFLSLHLLRHDTFVQPLLTLVALIPVPPLLFVMVAVVRFVNSIDELQRRIHLEALAFAAGATAMLAVTLAFLENAGFPRVSAFWAFVSVDLFWALALPFIRRRYS